MKSVAVVTEPTAVYVHHQWITSVRGEQVIRCTSSSASLATKSVTARLEAVGCQVLLDKGPLPGTDMPWAAGLLSNAPAIAA